MFAGLPIPSHVFNSVNQFITSFIWGNKVPRVNKCTLQRGREVGGLGLPSFIHYYWASNIQNILFWLHRPDTDWCLLESQSCYSSSLPALVYFSLPLKPSQFTSNPVVLSTLNFFNQFSCHCNFTSASVLCPIHHLVTIYSPPTTLDSTFRQWGLNGLMCIKDLYNNNIFDSFDNLHKKHGLRHNHFFKYRQVRHFAMKKMSLFS